ncbi:hypothetical protein PHMEG_0003849 [Phytophthora megakarya]|uniref:Uncharacterized protein n=1 Tax=Phytophthora megakarya TaxID=4795 RepID=A0A225WVG3_9STRA|nr:hypothetical protein PHMEG_0003849 [Phytophthora megakarya]
MLPTPRRRADRDGPAFPGPVSDGNLDATTQEGVTLEEMPAKAPSDVELVEVGDYLQTITTGFDRANIRHQAKMPC